jgi:hypothetical protein
VTAAVTWGWRILVGLSGLLLLNGVALYLFVDTQTERTIGVLLAAFAAMGLMVTLEGLRHGTRWAWTTTWVMVGSLTAVGLHMLRGDRIDLVLFYIFLAGVALVGQLLAGRSLRP